MKEEICKAFCNEVTVREVPVGLAISTAFRRSDGDAVAFYVVRDPARPGLAHLEDDGETIPYLEAAGVDFETQTRARAFEAILAEYEAEFDDDEAIIRSREMAEHEIPRIALRFTALLLRLYDFLLLTQEHVESAFREDATKRIKEAIGHRAKIDEDEPVSPNLADVRPDLVVRAPDRLPVAVFLAQSSQKVNDAIFLQMAALYEAREPISVVALLEVENSINRDLRQRAANRLAAVPIYRGEEQMSVQRIVREALGPSASLY
jgi:Domain of unknown function DUF1828